ncbi:multidrug effflux MFS transporter [Mangrovibacterium diazotrophicum]|uniref:DHA1 family bicyclomycin/chloramphenicol resistance-like MFS transporter n=1 Tax=Mangrovibacterium diazotrophicum TaxID=1261403 RepID=A0A419WAA0_9BACT|nr:multidrug effflux MFS transporter [Mangrovibacterium diazotrophicum]RKD92387.1 DHA1 family bicyclomycin/chloramphenicol resistance-like MFS transporter [Mangrovibacterium diazotrophicum]
MTKKFLISRDNRFFIAQITFLLALLTSLSPFATDTYIPALPTMAKFFGEPINMVEISLTVYFIGVAVGQFFGGPLSDSFGRKTVALTGVLLFSVSSLLAIFITDVRILWALRFIQAIGGGGASVVNMAFVRDWFEGKDVARISSLISMIMMLAPLVAPVIGSFLLLSLGWKSIFIFMSAVAMLTFLLFIFFMPESRHPQHITHRLTATQLIGSYSRIFSSPKAVFLVLANSFAVSGMFVFLTGSSFLYIEYFKVDVSLFPVYFGANIIMNVALTFLNFRLVKTIEPAKILHVGLLLQLVSGLVLFFAVRAAEPSLWLVFLLMVSFIGSLGLIFSNTVALVINQFHEISGSANAVIGVIRFAFSGAVGSLLAVFHSGDLIPMGTIMGICTVLAYLLFTGSRFARH